MQAKAYALTTLAAGAGLFATLVGANLILDPHAVFGTGLFGKSPNSNDRYERFITYKTNSGSYDGLLFGSSRAVVFSPDELSTRMNGTHFDSFAVNGGSLFDHLPVLE